MAADQNTTSDAEAAAATSASSISATQPDSYKADDPIWFDPSGGNTIPLVPGIVVDYSATTQLVTVESSAIDNNVQVFHVPNTSVRPRADFIAVDGDNNNDENNVDDMINLRDINESALFWNLKKRYERNKIYTFVGDILVSMNPYKMFEIYGLNTVKKYQNQLRSAQPPHLFAIGNLAYNKMVKDGENQCILIMGESGSGKTENTKLLLQYLAAINKSPSNIITEQILESIPLLESFGNAKTTRNNNASRYCKHIEIYFNNGIITGAKTLKFLHEKSRIVSHNQDERNFHIFYELLEGLSESEKEKYGLQSADKYFYLNQGNCCQIDGKDDAEDFRFLIGAMQVLGFTNEEQDIIFRILSSILHLGNVYFHRKQFRHGQEGVEIGSDAEIRWVSHLLQIPIDDIYKMMTVRTTETRQERLFIPLNIDQALDMRDAISKVLYVSLFEWLVYRVNHIVHKSLSRRQHKIAILDMFGFENLKENNFEQLCINYANELMYSHYVKCVFRNEQQEYAKEKVEWQPIEFPDNQAILNLISKKPIGILPLLEDESNFPKASDNSFLEKCHYNHALNEIYSRARMSAIEFGIRHFEGQAWYSVEGFLDKNRDILKTDVMETLLGSKMSIVCKIFAYARDVTADSTRPASNRTAIDGRFVTIKPRTPTASARFQQSLTTLFEAASQCNPWFIRCIRPNNERRAVHFDDAVVFAQTQHSAIVETIRVRARGYPVRMKYAQFVARYHCFLVTSQLPRGTPSKEISRLIIEKKFAAAADDIACGYRFGFSKIFLKESAAAALEQDRERNLSKAAVRIQAHIRGYLARRHYRDMRRGIVRIQRAYRGYRERKNYQTLRRGIVRLQATYRMQRQKQQYAQKIKTIKEKLEANGRYRNAERTAKEAMKVAEIDEPRNRSQSVSSVNRLELPSDLSNLWSESDTWKCVHAYTDIVKMTKSVSPLRVRCSLPYDIDHHSFAKFTSIYFRSHAWGAKSEPIKAPFLQKNSDSDFQESLTIFQLVLRFMNDRNLAGKKEKLLADYIVQRGLTNVALRDEILCQLCNQTWKNDDEWSVERGWMLMTHCLCSFAPTFLLYKYLLKYVSDHAPNTCRPMLQRLLLTCDKAEPYNARTYPASLLEWKANVKKCGLSVDLRWPNGEIRTNQIDSWTTGERLTADMLHASGFNSHNVTGWTVDLDDDGDIYSLNGDSYVLDMIAQMELSPCFPASKNYFIAAKNAYRSARTLLNPYHNADLMNKFDVDGIVGNNRLDNNAKRENHIFLKSNVQRQLNQKMLRSLSGETLMRVEDVDAASSVLELSMNSKLNERYLKNHATSLQAFHKLIEADEEMTNGDCATAPEVGDVPIHEEAGAGGMLKLSEKSRLNQRYISNKAEASPNSKKPPHRKNLYARKTDKHANKLNQRSMSMQELGLVASSSLNIRYFSRDKLNKTASLTGGSDNDSDSLNKVQSLMNFRETEHSSPSSEGGGGGQPNKPFRKSMTARPLPVEPGANGLENGADYRLPGVLHTPPEHRGKHMIRPSSHSSSSASSSFESDTSSCINDTESALDSSANKDRPASSAATAAATAAARYKKYSNNASGGKLASQISKSQQYLNRSYHDRCGKESEYVMKSSAMSDTSEAPSLASHVRNIRIPSHTSELDQYLDDLFSPVLDANLDDAMSDARSLAQSIKGNSIEEEEEEEKKDNELNLESILFSVETDEFVRDLLDSKKLCKSLKGGVNEVEPNSSRAGLSQNSNPTDAGSNLALNFSGLNMNSPIDSNMLQQQMMQQQMYSMQQRAFLASSLQQNLEIQKQLLQQNQQLQHLLAQTVSSTPPPQSSSSSTTVEPPLNRSTSMSSLAYPISPIFSLSSGEKANSSVQQPQSAIAAANGKSNAAKISIVSPSAINTATPTNGVIKIIPPPPPPPPPLSPGTDVFGRAKTVRIGKWRWPPPSDEAGNTPSVNNNFIEFKRKKQIEKAQDKIHNNNNCGSDSSDCSSGGNGAQPRLSETLSSSSAEMAVESSPTLSANGKSSAMGINNELSGRAISSSFETKKIASRNGSTSSSSAASGPPKDIARKYSDNAIAPGSIGKLRISSEMRAKLEQLTIDQSVRGTKRDRNKEGGGVVASQSMDDLANMNSVKKLSEQRKALLERQLMGSLRTASTFMETTSTPNIKQTVDVVADSHHLHMQLSHENSVNSNYEPSSHVKKFIKNQQQNLLRKSGSREFRERREELGPFNRLSSSSVHVNYADRPLYTPDRYFRDKDDHPNGTSVSASVAGNHPFGDADSHASVSDSSNNERHSSSSDRFGGGGGRFSNLSANVFGKSKRMHMPPPPPPPMDTASLGNGPSSTMMQAAHPHAEHHTRSQDRLPLIDALDFADCQSVAMSESLHNGDMHGDIDERQLKTKLYHKNEMNFYAYSKPRFKLNLRKEIFSPTETVDNPILVDLIFWQVVSDVYSGNCIRLTDDESQKLQKQLKAEGVHSYNPALYTPKAAFKRATIDAAKQLPNYFSRLYVVSGGKSLSNVDYLGVTHAGVNLLRRDKSSKHDCLTVIEKLSYDDISEILIPDSCTLQILFNGGDWITLYSNKALQIRNLIEKFIVEHQQSSVEYVRAIKDFVGTEPSMLSFKKDNIIRVVKSKHLHLAKGWSFGVLEFGGESGLIQSAHVVPLTAAQVQAYQRQQQQQSQHHRSHHHHHQPQSMDDDSLRNHNLHHHHHHHHHQQQQQHHAAQQSMINGFNHSVSSSSKDCVGGGAVGSEMPPSSLENGSHHEFNSLWIESRAETVTEEGKLDMNGGNPASLSQFSDGNFSLLQFALFNFRESLTKYDMRGHLKENSVRGSIKMIENLKSKKKSKGKNGDTNDWTWSEFANLVKYSKTPIQASLLMLSPELSKVAIECFSAIMRYMGDLAMLKNQNEVDCVYTILMNCHKYGQIRDEIYCQLMKQTTSNKSARLDSCQRGWRLFSIVAAYFDCSETLQPYLFKYLETAAFDKRRAFHVTATIAFTNLKKTFKYGGRKNVPSIEEIAAISAGRTSKRQMYRLPGGTERVLNTSCTTVVNDIIEEICLMLNVTSPLEMEEFSLYCIIEGDPFTMPLNRDEYILDVTTELLKNGQLFYLIFCRSVWYHPLRLDSDLYIEVVFNQVAPDYLEGLLIIVPNEKLPEDITQQIARIASLLHRAAELDQMPSKDEIKYLLPKPVLAMRNIKPHQWVEMVQNHWNDMSALSPIEAKAQCLDILQKWPLFGSCFFAVKRIHNDSHTHPDHILALNKDGVHFLDMVSHEKVWKHPFSEVLSTRKVRSEDGTLYLDMKCGNLMVQKITRIQTDQAHEISRLIRQYIEIEQHLKSGQNDSNASVNGKQSPSAIDQP